MKTKLIKRRLAAALAVLMLLPTQSVIAANAGAGVPEETKVEVQEPVHSPSNAERTKDDSKTKPAESEVEDDELLGEELENDLIADPESEDEASPSDAQKRKPQDEVVFNTGSADVSVVSYEDFSEYELGDAYFEEDGSYIINIPEENPFFPYEVQFTADGETTEEWFMTPDDTVEIGGHTFYVSAYFDGNMVTQLSLDVGGETVVVYPEEKKFTDDGGISAFSLMPLQEAPGLTVDLTDFTPLELTQVKIDSIFAGEAEFEDTDRIMWKQRYSDDSYEISSSGDVINLSYGTSESSTTYWEMIVGAADQLETSNIRYPVSINVSESRDWLLSEIELRDGTESSRPITILDSEYRDWYDDYPSLWIDVLSEELVNEWDGYLSLYFQTERFDQMGYDIRAFEGSYYSAEEAEASREISDELLYGGGYFINMKMPFSITLAAYDAGGQCVGCLPLEVEVLRNVDYVSGRLYTDSGVAVTDRGYGFSRSRNYRDIAAQLKRSYPLDGTYRLVLEYEKVNPESDRQVLGAFIGKYEELDDAIEAGAEDIRDVLFDAERGYAADFSKGVYVTVFVGTENGSELTQAFRACITTVEEEPEQLSDSTYVSFYGLRDAEGNDVSCQVIDDNDDYADHNFITILVDADADLTALAPEFYCYEGIELYTAGSSVPEVSGKSIHDFSKGMVQYTASSEDKASSKNYWLQVLKPSEGTGVLYINSLDDPDAETRVENGITYSTREMFVDGRYDYKHDILLLNTGTKPLEKLSVELDSDQVELDQYWTLTGENDFQGFTGTGYRDTWNQAKLRLVQKDGAARGSEISGTMTIKAGDVTLMVLNLTGIVGDPGIVTSELPDAVKYVHYGTMIQNSNKYDFNEVSYELVDGDLPEGMVLKSNGELYGVPLETGEFDFTVLMENDYSYFTDSEAELTLTVVENTDENVENATDRNYELIERVPDIALADNRDYTMTSVGVFDEWENLYLDGEMLTEGVDYDAESGSTRLTIRSQTLKAGNTVGTHTLSAEFRTSDSNVMKRAAQNYKVSVTGGNGSSGGNNGSGGNSSSDRSSSDDSSGSQSRDPKKGYMSSQSGIITGDGSGYSRWMKDENGWKLIYADGTAAAGSMIQQENGSQIEQVLWEKINGSYYAFSADGYLSAGWVYDYLLNEWYYVTENSGMMSGWYNETQDGHTYYLNPANGALAHGWKQITGKWYYLNEVFVAPTWTFDPESKTWFYNVASKNKPWGALYRNETTPDGYQVDADGVWNGNN